MHKRYQDLGTIFVVDDARINIEAIKLTFEEIGFNKNITYCYDSLAVIDDAMAIFKKALLGTTFPVRPIQLMLLDFHMPMKNGLEVI
jgi:CheY-like chemotaxis protein